MVNLGKIVKEAVAARTRHFAEGIPMRIAEGFKEANIAHDLSAAFRNEGFLVFPEFPYARGSIDGVFVRGNDMVICEWKRLYPRSIPRVAEQTERMMKFDPTAEMKKHRFRDRDWKVSRLWVCDTWLADQARWWVGKPSKVGAARPFDKQWKFGSHRFQDFGEGWYPYFWVWAFQGPSSSLSGKSRFVWRDDDIAFVASGPKAKTKSKR